VIFVDTGFLFAFFSEDDVNHARVAEVFEEFKGRNLPEILVTTDHVVSETITLTRYRISHERAVFVGERLYSEKMAHPPGELRGAACGLRLLQAARGQEVQHGGLPEFRGDESLGIREALAVDEDFTHRFVARPGPRPKR